MLRGFINIFTIFIMPPQDTRYSSDRRLFAEALCKHRQRYIAKAGMAPLAVVEYFHVLSDRGFSLRAGCFPPLTG